MTPTALETSARVGTMTSSAAAIPFVVRTWRAGGVSMSTKS